MGLDVVRRATARELADTWQAALCDWLMNGAEQVLEVGIDPKASGATLGLLVVEPPTWAFAGVGDINIMVCDSADRALTLPTLHRFDLYGYAPDLLLDRSAEVEAIESTGTCLPGDAIFMFTDGIGQWLVENANAETIRTLREIDTETFTSVVEELRMSLDLVRDDATLIRCILS